MTNDTHIPNAVCPKCGGNMIVKTNRQRHSVKFGTQFAGCANFPRCAHARELEPEDIRAIAHARAEFEKQLQEQEW
jgi:ssDNA-binding Zn-finger/Zn-ribbon topoisomerase 1